MATENVSPIRPTEPPTSPDEFGPLMRRFLVAMTMVRFSNNSELEIRCLGVCCLTSDRIRTRGQIAE